MKLALLLLLFIVPVVLATTINYIPPTNIDLNDTNITFGSGTGIIVTEANGTFNINFDTTWGDARYLQTFTELDPIFVASNASIWAAILNISLTPGPQGPQGIPGVNGSNAFNITQIILNGAAPWFYNDSTATFFNATLLNSTIQAWQPRAREVNVTLIAPSTATSALLSYEITQLIVTPTTPGNNYHFNATTGAGLVVDRDRTTHTGVWNIRKTFAINDTLAFSITNASINESFTITARYVG